MARYTGSYNINDLNAQYVATKNTSGEIKLRKRTETSSQALSDNAAVRLQRPNKKMRGLKPKKFCGFQITFTTHV